MYKVMHSKTWMGKFDAEEPDWPAESPDLN